MTPNRQRNVNTAPKERVKVTSSCGNVMGFVKGRLDKVSDSGAMESSIMKDKGLSCQLKMELVALKAVETNGINKALLKTTVINENTPPKRIKVRKIAASAV